MWNLALATVILLITATQINASHVPFRVKHKQKVLERKFGTYLLWSFRR